MACALCPLAEVSLRLVLHALLCPEHRLLQYDTYLLTLRKVAEVISGFLFARRIGRINSRELGHISLCRLISRSEVNALSTQCCLTYVLLRNCDSTTLVPTSLRCSVSLVRDNGAISGITL